LNLDDPIKITWIDIEDASEWMTMAEAKTPPDAIVDTLGFYCGEDKDYLYVSSSVIRDCDQRNRTAICKGVIKKIQKIMFYGDLK